jgi:DNA-binding NarL/FixJ family response regulator
MKTILVVDNTYAHKKLASLFPEYEVVWARNVRQARRHLAARPFDLVVCAIEVAEEPAFELLRSIKDAPGQTTKVLCWLRLTDALDRFRGSLMTAATAMGVVGFVSQEADDDELAEYIQQHLLEDTPSVDSSGGSGFPVSEHHPG